jgi:hypothetical protein
MGSTTLNTEKIIIQPEIIKTEIILFSSELNQEKEKQLKHIQKHIQLPGFRPGKVPMSIVKKKYESMAFYEAFEELLKDKTIETIEAQVDTPLYYVYDFDAIDEIKDENKDIKLGLEMLIEPKVNIDVHNRELELVKYTFTENQRKIFSDLIILFNFGSDDGVSEILDDFNTHFILNLEVESPLLANSENASKKEKATFSLCIHQYEFELYGLNTFLSSPLEKGKSYSVDLQKWIEILKSHPQSSEESFLDELEEFTKEGETTINFKIINIIKYDNFAEKLNIDGIRKDLELNENDEVNLDILYTKLNEIIDIVSDYFSGMENIIRINEFINSLFEVKVPDYFIEKLYKTYLDKEDRETTSIELFKLSLEKDIQNKIIGDLLPNAFSEPTEYEEFINNVANYYLVDNLVSKLYFIELESIKDFISDTIQDASNDDEYAKLVLDGYISKDAIFTIPKRIEKDITVHYKLENINKVHIAEYLGIKEETFV